MTFGCRGTHANVAKCHVFHFEKKNQLARKAQRAHTTVFFAMRSILRICQYHNFDKKEQDNKPKYFYEGKDHQNITIYEKNVRVNGKSFAYDQIYGNTVQQFDFFQQEMQQQIANFMQVCIIFIFILQGKDCTVIMFGHCYGGRRFTFEGTLEMPGLYHRSVEAIFNCIGNIYF